jgi:hypothetical protein
LFESEALEFQVFSKVNIVLPESHAAEVLRIAKSTIKGAFGSSEITLEFVVQLALLFVPEAAFRLCIVKKLLHFVKALLRSKKQPLFFGGLDSKGEKDRAAGVVFLKQPALRASHSSAFSSGNSRRWEQQPCLVAFLLEICLPSEVRGPVERPGCPKAAAEECICFPFQLGAGRFGKEIDFRVNG